MFATSCETLEARAVLAANSILALGAASGPAGGTVDIPVTVAIPAGEPAEAFSAFNLAVAYDPAVLDFVSAAPTDFTSGFSLSTATFSGAAGLLTLTSFTSGPTSQIDATSGSRVLAKLTFSIRSDAIATTSVVNLLATAKGVTTKLLGSDASEAILTPAPTNAATDSVDGSVTVTANSYTVTYDVNGGIAVSPTTKSVTFGSAYGTLV